MLHLGDITKLHGDQIPVVDIITGGSPCQDLSVAGKRAGLDGERSGLFMEQIRIVKEMRERDRRAGRTAWLIRPRFMVWENVPGAFSSNKGRDFQAVLSEIVKIAEPGAPDVPLPEGGRWSKVGCLYSTWDDVGYWSIAWRVHDAQFWGVPQRRKRIALVADFGGLAAPEILFERKGLSRDIEPGGEARERITGSVENGAYPAIARSLTRRYDGSPCIDRGPNTIVQGAFNPWDSQSADVAHTLKAKANCDFRADSETYPVQNSVVRRLTPLECERLQGYPDGWTDIGEWIDRNGKKHKAADSPRYKALGNSIALPFWQWMARRICAQYERTATMGSLFDGTGGFPLVFQRSGAIPVWASEIEEFPIAVTKRHFPEKEEHNAEVH